ncbi:hypothetical protein [Streptococcus loxodontisalivarius]|uniref:DUF4176 domain-containing protein n=1 Tax=Streptococcus loxodontisalivarius TaxID=1349415 RepID=A0ABS2PUR6_9STRE|nr:hypothetical protein [Streptococcus loxodontisalivarius]MBM7643189.1 hypothetical protein [Streptococcus loxodontisalivarius]
MAKVVVKNRTFIGQLVWVGDGEEPIFLKSGEVRAFDLREDFLGDLPVSDRSPYYEFKWEDQMRLLNHFEVFVL